MRMKSIKRRCGKMSRDHQQEQDQNTAKLVMNAFYKVADNKDGASASEITDYLQDKFGDVWKMSTLTWKAEETLKRSAVLGFLERQGSRYVANVARGCCRRAKRRSVKKKPCRRCQKKRPRPCCC